MRASPAFQVNLQHFTLWRAAVAGLALIAFGCNLAWCASGSEPRSVAVWVISNSITMWLAVTAVRAARSTALSLRWDTLDWRLGPMASVGEEPTAGQLTVVMDLGSWMLLRFVQTEPTVLSAVLPYRFRPQRCLAVQRKGLEPSWHALRCAVYSSRPGKLAPALDHPHHPTVLE
jgi:hypothetical protein